MAMDWSVPWSFFLMLKKRPDLETASAAENIVGQISLDSVTTHTPGLSPLTSPYFVRLPLLIEF